MLCQDYENISLCLDTQLLAKSLDAFTLFIYILHSSTYLWGVVLDIELHLELILIIADFSLGRHVVRLGNSSFGNCRRYVGGTLGNCLLGLELWLWLWLGLLMGL